MKSARAGALLVLVFLTRSTLQAQDIVPAHLPEVEIARSRACVANLARLAELEAALEPYTRSVARLNALGLAVSLEKAEDAAPFDTADPIEAAVARWFATDSALALRYIAQPDSAIQLERRAARTAILDQLRQAIQEVSEDAQATADQGAAVQQAAQPCTGAILVRGAVLEECATTPSPVCEQARAEEPDGSYLFVDDPLDLWDVEQYGAWTTAAPLRRDPDGSLAGARTSARARHGNIVVAVSLAPLLRRRAELSEEEVRQFQENLDSLGFSFEHPLFVMAPAIEFQVNLPEPLDGESVYVLHFGDLSGDDVIWSMEGRTGGFLQGLVPATSANLARLRAGEILSFTAIRPSAEEGAPAEAIYTLSMLQAGQAQNVGALLDYMAGGVLGRDLQSLVPQG